jgi:hypothetical protein
MSAYKVSCETGKTNGIKATANGLTLTVNPAQQSAFNELPQALREMISAELIPRDIRIGSVISGFMRELVTGNQF